MKKILFILLTLIFIFNHISAIEIQTQDVRIIRVGVIDINKVISEFPLAQKAQQEIELFKQNKLSELSVIEKELEDVLKQQINLTTEIEQLKHQIKQIETEIQTSTLTISSTGTIVNADEKSIRIQQIKDEIIKKQKNLEQIDQAITEKKEKIKSEKEKIEKEIEEKKQKYEVEIYIELYKIIQKIAQQEKLNLIIDKSGILYGESQIDITQKVINLIKKQQ
ncbi:MAG: OmpH family outer membrane protein [Elusimicrobiota bacterium]|nr:OmpH family outer membrane protein [Endomicrobiia bacterium]MDW8165302.1 OmpH family outer membrane protein [Elusimicrobiota bacterium]